MEQVRSGSGALSGFVVFLLIWLLIVPFACFLHVFPLVSLPSYFIAAAAVFFGWVYFFASSGRAVCFSRLDLLILLLFVVLIFSAYMGAGAGSDLRVLIIFGLVLFLTAQLGVTVSNRVEDCYRLIALVVLAGGLLQVVAAIALHYGLLDASLKRWFTPPGPRMTGLFSQFNYLGMYIFCAFLSASYLYIKKVVTLGFLCFVAVFLGFALAATGSRAILLYVLISFLALAWLCWSRRCWWFGLFAGFVLLAVGGGGYWLVDGVVQPALHELGYIDRLAVGDIERDYGTIGLRLSEWHKSLIMLWESPLFGVGFGSYSAQSFWMGVEYPWAISEGTLTTHGHNIFTQVGAEFGLIGLSALVFFVVYVVRFFVLLDKSPEWWFVCSVCGVFFVASMLEYPLWELHLAVFLIFLVAPLFSGGVVVRLSGSVVLLVSVGVSVLWGVLSWGAFDVYRKSIIYNSGVYDELDVIDLSVAGQDALWGREMNLLLLKHVEPTPTWLAYYDKLTMEMMQWRPVELVLIRRLQVVALKEEFPEIIRLSKALVRIYPNKVQLAREFLLEKEGIKGTESARVIKENLDLR